MGMNIRKDTRVLEKMIRENPRELDNVMREASQNIVDDIIQSFGSSPPGRVHDGHIASQPGYPPNVDTGQLRASMRWEKKAPLRYWVLDGVEYGIHLEIGTTELAARPFVGPVFKAWQDRKFIDAVRRVMDK